MPQAAYPAELDLNGFLAAAGLNAGQISLTPILNATTREWQRRTAWEPFQAEVGTRTFALPCGRELELDAGLLSVTELTVDGEVLTADEDYFLRPSSAPAQGEPYTRIVFTVAHCGQRAAEADLVSITGSWGYAAQIPDDVWQGLLEAAARRAAQSLASLATLLGAKSAEMGSTKIEYAPVAEKTNFIARDLVLLYKRDLLA